MRKYHQLLLVIITVFSLGTLLMYRHEYLKLRYVLEVLSFFGSPQETFNSKCSVLNETFQSRKQRYFRFSNPPPTWTKIDQFFIYSAFYKSGKEKDSVRAITVGPHSNFYNYECRVWFDNNGIISSIKGKFQYTSVYHSKSKQDTVDLFMYLLICEPEENHDLVYGSYVPHGVIFSNESGSNSRVFIPVHHHSTDKNSDGQSVICVKPDKAGLQNSVLVEFVSFHHSIGITDFIIYDNGVQHGILPILQSLAGRSGFSESLSVLSWNFPFSNTVIEDLVIKHDCLLRSADKVPLVIISSWQDYIIPIGNTSIKGMFSSVISLQVPINLKISNFFCCTNFQDNRESQLSWPLALRKTQCVEPNTTSNSIYIHFDKFEGLDFGHRNDLPTKVLPSNVGILNQYITCDNHPTKLKLISLKPILAKFLGNFMTDKLCILWKSGSLSKIRHSKLVGLNLQDFLS